MEVIILFVGLPLALMYVFVSIVSQYYSELDSVKMEKRS
jgi:hypothetical protein